MARLTEWIEEMADGETIEAVVIGPPSWGQDARDQPPYTQNVVLDWEQARPLLEREFDDGFGSPKCPAVAAWTRSWVIAVSTYDGSTGPFRLPRHPVDHVPEMPGG